MCTIDFRNLNRKSPLFKSFVISNLALSQSEPFSAGDLVRKGKEHSVELDSAEVENQLKSLTKQGYLGRVMLHKFVVLKTVKQ